MNSIRRPSAAPVFPQAHPRPVRRTARALTVQQMLPYLLLAGMAAALVALLALPAAFFAYYQLSQRIVPGVFVGETAVGGMRIEQAAVELHRVWNLERRLAVTEGVHTWSLPPASLGLSVDVVETARQAYAVGHDQSLAAEASQMVYSLRKGVRISPVVQFDPRTAQAGLEALVPEASLPAKNAGVRLEADGLVAVPAEVGYTINIPDTLAFIQANPYAVLAGGTLRLALMPVVAPVTDVSSVLAVGQRLLDTPPVIEAFDPIRGTREAIPVSRQVVASWLVVSEGPQGPAIHLDEARIASYLRELALGDPDGVRYLDVDSFSAPLAEAVHTGTPITLRVRYRPATYVVEPGDTLIRIGWKVGIPYWMILQANPGLDPDSMRAGQELALPSKDDLLPLPVSPNKRIVISISQQRLWRYEHGEQISEDVISTGIDRSPTQPGVFQIQTHEVNAYASVWDLHMPHFMGIYEAWPGFMNGIHGLPTLSNGRRLWANILGRPASYGCIILDLQAAETLFHWAEKGVVVEIQP